MALGGHVHFWIHLKARSDKYHDVIMDVKTYIENILVLIKGSFTKHIFQIIFIFVSLHKSGLKVGANKYSFGNKYIP